MGAGAGRGGGGRQEEMHRVERKPLCACMHAYV